MRKGAKSRNDKIFPAPAFQPAIALAVLKEGKVRIEKTIGLRDDRGNPLSGLPPGPDLTGAAAETPLDEQLQPLDPDPEGLDPEGVAP